MMDNEIIIEVPSNSFRSASIYCLPKCGIEDETTWHDEFTISGDIKSMKMLRKVIDHSIKEKENEKRRA